MFVECREYPICIKESKCPTCDGCERHCTCEEDSIDQLEEELRAIDMSLLDDDMIDDDMIDPCMEYNCNKDTYCYKCYRCTQHCYCSSEDQFNIDNADLDDHYEWP